MPLTQLSDLTGYEVSLVPQGANKKKRFLITKEDGELTMDELLQQILKEGMKDEEATSEIAKAMDMSEEQEKVFKAIMKIMESESCPLSKEQLKKALAGGVEKMDDEDEDKKDIEKEGNPFADKNKDKKDEDKKDIEKEEDEKDEENINKEGDTMSKVPVIKEDGSWDLSKVEKNLRPSLEVICKSNEQLTKTISIQKQINETLADKLKASEDARILKEFVEKAESYGHLGDSALDLAKILKTAHDADPENCIAIESVLKAANNKINESSLFEEAGSNGGFDSIAGSAWGKIEKHADELVKHDSKINHADAIDLVLKRHPELYSEYESEKRRIV